MKIKLLACFALVAIMSSCGDEEQITPKDKNVVNSFNPKAKSLQDI